MRKQNPPKHHHYLPRFYQNGFYGKDKKHFVYDKREDRILPPSTSKSKFGINDLNTIKLAGNENRFIETKIYKEIDTFCSLIFNKIRISSENGNDLIDDYEKVSLLLGICHLFWRIPSSSKNLNSLLKQEGVNTEYFSFVDIEENLDLRLEQKLLDFFLENNEIQKAAKLFYPFASYYSGELLRMAVICRFHYSLKPYKLLTGDNPFILMNNQVSIDNILGEFIFPICHDKLLFVKKEQPKFLDETFYNYLNLNIINQSERFVCSGDENSLVKMVEVYNKIKKEGLEVFLREELFSHLEKLEK